MLGDLWSRRRSSLKLAAAANLQELDAVDSEGGFEGLGGNRTRRDLRTYIGHQLAPEVAESIEPIDSIWFWLEIVGSWVS